MQDLYILVIDGQTVNHPSLKSNLLETFGELPPEYQPFVRKSYEEMRDNLDHFVKKPMPEDVQYVLEDGVWTDHWELVPMNEEEIAAKKVRMVSNLTRALEEKIEFIDKAITDTLPAKWRYTLLDHKERLQAFNIPADPWNYTHQQLIDIFPDPREFDNDGNLIGDLPQT